MPKCKTPKKSSSHLVAGLVAGAAVAVAAAYYLNTPKGKKMLHQAEKKAIALQNKMMIELGKTKNLTKEKYDEIVEKLLAYYGKTKDISESELPEIRDYLKGKWKVIQKEYKNMK